MYRKLSKQISYAPNEISSFFMGTIVIVSMILKMVLFHTLCQLICYSLLTTNGEKHNTKEENNVDDTLVDFSDNAKNPTELVLIGATGDLAARFLWSAVFRLFIFEGCDTSTFMVYAATRQPVDIIEKYINEVVKQKILHCRFFPRESECKRCHSAFFESVVSRQLTGDEHYRLLGQEISKRVNLSPFRTSIIVYLAVPPFSYHKISKAVDRYFRVTGADLKVVLEKPFGHDFESSSVLLERVGQHITEHETYRIDHYLGKQTVDKLLHFRQKNAEILDKLADGNGIGLVEIVMKETLDCRNRTEFYDRYGVVLDVMQNHLTEVLARVIMDIPGDLSNNSQFIMNKQNAIGEVFFPVKDNVVLGQYNQYNTHIDEDLNNEVWKSRGEWILSRTPTFAAVLMYTANKRWENVPFILLSGKQLNEKSTYIRLWFKERNEASHLVSNFEDEHEVAKHSSIIFYIHSAVFNGPAIVIQGDASSHKYNLGGDWQKIDYDCHNCKVFRPKSVIDPYSMLLKAVALGQKSKFIGKEELLYSWKLWTPLIHRIKTDNPILYDQFQIHPLNFKIIPETQQLSSLQDNSANKLDSSSFCRDVSLEWPDAVYNSYSVPYLVHKLALQIACLSQLSLSKKEQFHVALPGGKSVTHLIKALIRKKEYIVWHIFHVWFIDERCVPINNSYSNYKLLKDSLFDNVPLRKENIHPILDNRQEINCKGAAEDYENKIKTIVPKQAFDLIVLGLGEDSHIASVFPDDSDTISTTLMATSTEKGPEHSVKSRITLTPAVMKLSKRIVVLVFGKRKKTVYQNICHRLHSVNHLKFLRSNKSNQKIGWFVDKNIGSCKGERVKDEL